MTLVPRQHWAANLQEKGNTERAAFAGYNNTLELLGGASVVFAPSGTFTTEAIVAAGCNQFMMTTFAATNTVSITLNHLDPETLAVLFQRVVATPAIGATALTNMGAFTGAAGGQNDIFLLISFTFTNTSGAGASTLSAVRLWSGVR